MSGKKSYEWYYDTDDMLSVTEGDERAVVALLIY